MPDQCDRETGQEQDRTRQHDGAAGFRCFNVLAQLQRGQSGLEARPD